MRDGHKIAMSVDPNVSNDVCTFCKHADWSDAADILGAPKCQLGYECYFRSISNLGPIWVSDCEAGELKLELAALEAANG